jgi:hypothetical protein
MDTMYQVKILVLHRVPWLQVSLYVTLRRISGKVLHFNMYALRMIDLELLMLGSLYITVGL